MAAITVASFSAFANLVVAACKLASDPDPVAGLKALADIATGAKSLDAALATTGLAAVAAEMARAAEDHARHFTHAGPARDDAIALFWQVAPAAFADPAATFAVAHLDPALTTDRMVAAIKASPLGREFSAAPLPEQFFRAVVQSTLRVMLARADTVAALAPALWRESLRQQDNVRQGQEEGCRASELRDGEMLAILRRLESTKEAAAARAAGISDERILGLLRRIAPDVPDPDHAFAELERLVEVAIEVQARGRAGSKTGDFVDAVLVRMAELSAEGRDDEAATEADRAFAEWEERQRLEAQKGVAVLEAGLRADILRRDPASAARRIIRGIEIETPDPPAAFVALRDEIKSRYEIGAERGILIELEISDFLACEARSRAEGPLQAGAAFDDLGNIRAALGERQGSASHLRAAIEAYRTALEIRPRALAPLDWVTTSINLGNVLTALGEWRADALLLHEAIGTLQAALDDVPRRLAVGMGAGAKWPWWGIWNPRQVRGQ